MKKYITFLFLAIGLSTFSYAQTASIGNRENVRSHKKLVKQVSHFTHPRKKDRKIQHNGTLVSREIHMKKCHPDSVFFTEHPSKPGSKKWRKVKNLTFGTYTMK